MNPNLRRRNGPQRPQATRRPQNGAGNARQHHERYLARARDAQLSGDVVEMENLVGEAPGGDDLCGRAACCIDVAQKLFANANWEQENAREQSLGLSSSCGGAGEWCSQFDGKYFPVPTNSPALLLVTLSCRWSVSWSLDTGRVGDDP
jgi:hypothetical protein